MKELSFANWLMKQVDRDDPIGDLARDVMRDRDAPTKGMGLKDWRQYLQARGASPEALQTLRKAWYKGWQPYKKAQRPRQPRTTRKD